MHGQNHIKSSKYLPRRHTHSSQNTETENQRRTQIPICQKTTIELPDIPPTHITGKQLGELMALHSPYRRRKTQKDLTTKIQEPGLQTKQTSPNPDKYTDRYPHILPESCKEDKHSILEHRPPVFDFLFLLA